MDGDTEIQLKAGATFLALALLLLARFGPLRRARGLETGLHVGAAILGVLVFFNFGFFRHHSDEGFVNLWEQFHYRLGSKYFAELGYDGLYAASLAAQAESAPWIPMQPVVRDLRSYVTVPTVSYRPLVEEVRGRFSPERWQEFLADHEAFLSVLPPEILADIRLDHGYNPTPAWTFTAQLVGGRLGSDPASLRFLGSLDVLLALAFFAAIFRCFGTRTGCLAVAIFGLGYGWRYNYVGAFLRFDWLAAVVFGLCALERRRAGLAGLCFGWAAALRVFPALFLLGPGVLALRQLLRGELPGWAIRLGAGFVAAVSVGLVAGFFAGRGPEAWVEFATKIDLHRESWAGSRVGMDNVILNGPALARGLAAGTIPRLEHLDRAEIQGVLAERRLVGLLVKGTGFLLLSLALVRASLVGAAVLGPVAIFLLTPVGSYYWIMLLVVPLRRESAALGVIALAAALWWLHGIAPGREWNAMRFAVLSVGLAAFFVAWMLPDALRASRGAAAARVP